MPHIDSLILVRHTGCRTSSSRIPLSWAGILAGYIRRVVILPSAIMRRINSARLLHASMGGEVRISSKNRHRCYQHSDTSYFILIHENERA